MADENIRLDADDNIATTEEEAHAMVARMGGVVQIPDDDEGSLTDAELHAVVGGCNAGEAQVGDMWYVAGELFATSYCELYSGVIRGNYVIQRYCAGRPAPYLLKTNVGWVKAETLKYRTR